MVTMMSGLAAAQTPPPEPYAAKKGRIGAGLVLGLPIGDFGDAITFSIGGLADFDYVITPAIAITGRVGYIQHLVDSDHDGFSFSTIPFWGGAKYYFGLPGASARPFGAAELGINFNHAKVEANGFSVSNTDTDLGLNVGGGVELGAISLRVWLAFLDLGHASDSTEIMASASYFFFAF